MSITIRHIAGQAVAYGLFALTIAWFSSHPPYQRMTPGSGVLKLSLTHAGQRKDACHARTPEELAKLAPNMRAKQSCQRERQPVMVELDIDGQTVFSQSAAPAGLSKDGASRFYSRFTIPAGEHRIRARLRDSARTEGFDREEEVVVMLEPRQIFVVDYAGDEGRFIFN